MAPHNQQQQHSFGYISKTQHYQKVQKPLLERQRRARINKCLDALKLLVAEFQNDDAIMRMDKAEMLEATIDFMRSKRAQRKLSDNGPIPLAINQNHVDGFRNGYMNAVTEVSRILASTPGMNIDFGKSVMKHLGRVFNRFQQPHSTTTTASGTTAEITRTTMTATDELSVAAQRSTTPLTQINSESIGALQIDCLSAPLSPASSGYHSDCDSPIGSPRAAESPVQQNTLLWRPW